MSRRKQTEEERLIDDMTLRVLDRHLAEPHGATGSRLVRQVILEHLAKTDRHGSAAAASAIAATGSNDPAAWRGLLVEVAGKIIEAPEERALTLTADESTFVYLVLSEIADGIDPRKGLRIAAQTIGHRPSKMDLRWRTALEVQERIDEGDAVGEAIRAVAKITGRTIDQVRLDHRLLQSQREKS